MTTFFAPQLFIPNGIFDISFYEKAFNAIIQRRWDNDDGSLHVAEISIEEALFHIHEARKDSWQLIPNAINGTTVLVGIFVDDVDKIMEQALSAGATLVSPATTYDYAYRQGEIKDPFGHIWLIEKKL